MTDYLASVTLQQQDDGTWIWVWEMPDGAASMGTADTQSDAEERAMDAIRNHYTQTN